MSIGHFDASHSAEALSILEDEGQSLLGRAHKARRELVEFAFAPLLPVRSHASWSSAFQRVRSGRAS